jgi:hypothetical protein
VWPGRASDGALPGFLCLGLTQGADDTQAAPEMHCVNRVMREYDEDEDPKWPRPVRVVKKESNEFESAEVAPWRTTRKDFDRDHHRHVV